MRKADVTTKWKGTEMLQAKWIFGIGEGFEEIKAVRTAVFVEEQGYSLEEEFDAGDDYAWHALITYDGTPIATGRLYIDKGRYTLGRICVGKEYRGQNVGDLVVRLLLDRALQTEAEGVYLSAQEYAVGFYEKFGLRPVGEPHMGEGEHIPHVDMYAPRAAIVFPRACEGCANKDNCGIGEE
ncbi:GNAT family N-acetyltransferase [Eubacteriales bacterium OttesenSCG-928-M02]|nr:GNAT family N-acetyltransferase [Eubacteriales bacterium OttesenSCG-928-M02]